MINTVKIAFQDLADSFQLAKFPTKNFFMWIMFVYLSLILSQFSPFVHPMEVPQWIKNSPEQDILLKFLPGLLIFCVLTIYNIITKPLQLTENANSFIYFLIGLPILIILYIVAFLIKELTGTFVTNFYHHSVQILALGGNIPINFFFRGLVNFFFAIPVVCLAVYFLIVIANFASRLISRVWAKSA